MSSIFDWLVDDDELQMDTTRIVARGISTGGYYAMRVAHTHAERLYAVVAQGGACHRMFDAAWIQAQDQMEYPFGLAEALATKFGYGDGTDAVATYALAGRRFSLSDSGVLNRPSCPMLVINGAEDSIFPAEDSVLVAFSGPGKDLILRANLGHMGNPGAEEILYNWIDDKVTAPS